MSWASNMLSLNTESETVGIFPNINRGLEGALNTENVIRRTAILWSLFILDLGHKFWPKSGAHNGYGIYEDAL